MPERYCDTLSCRCAAMRLRSDEMAFARDVSTQVIYMADFIEPTRDFEGVELLRKLAYEDLDKAMLTGMDMIIHDMRRDGRPIHRNTQAAREWLAGKGN